MSQRNQKQINFEKMYLENMAKEQRAFYDAIPQILETIVVAINDNDVKHENWQNTVAAIRDHYSFIRANGRLPFAEFDRDETNNKLQSIIMLFNSFNGLTNGRLSFVKSGAKQAYGKLAYIGKFELMYVTEEWKPNHNFYNNTMK